MALTPARLPRCVPARNVRGTETMRGSQCYPLLSGWLATCAPPEQGLGMLSFGYGNRAHR